MSQLERWHPVTHDFGLIECPPERVVTALEDWHGSLGTTYQRTAITASLADALAALLPLSNSKMRRLFVATQSGWTACFQNGIQGSDPFPAMSYLARRMGVLAMRVCATPDGEECPAAIWELYASESAGGDALGYRRAVAAAKDGDRWTFHQSGEPYAFEQTERYESRRTRDRFTRDMLRDYLRHFGIELFRDDFMRVDAAHPAIRLQQLTNLHAMPEFTLEEVVAKKPWLPGR